jgi:SP family arabinose:H+ symporter-like MFS transporter
VAAIGGFLFGFDLGMIGAANIYLRDQFQLNDAQFGFATASAGLGCILGPFLGAWLCDAIGRKRTMIVAAFLLAVGAVFTAVPDFLPGMPDGATLAVFNLFRALGGLGVGLCSIASPMYIAEVAPPIRRGGLGLMYQLAIVVGHIAAPAIGYVVVLVLPHSDGVPALAWQQPWRWMFASETVAVLLFVIFVFRLPRSPRWLAQKGRYEEAQAVLTRIDGPEYARREIEEIKASLAQEAGGWSELFAPGMRYALLIGLLLALFNNWTGWSVIGGYIPMLFEMSGLEDRARAILQFAVTYGFMGLMTLVSLVLMDRVGRRPLWLFASLLMAAVTAAAGLVFHFQVTGFLVLLVIILCTVPHGIGLGGIPWLMMSELFPTRIRAKAVSVTTTFLWITIFTGGYLFPTLTAFSEKTLRAAHGASMTAATIGFRGNVITDSDNGFCKAGFKRKDRVAVSGASQAANNSVFTVHSVDEGTMLIESNNVLVDESAGAPVSIHVGSLGGAFWLFTGVCLLSFLFGLLLMPETKGRTLEEIANSWKKP